MTVTLKDIFGSPVVNQSKDLEIHSNKERESFYRIHILKKSQEDTTIYGIILKERKIIHYQFTGED